MVIDYSPRKPVGKNKPRKQPGKSLAGLLLGIAGAGYLAGLGSGWLFFHSPPAPITIKQMEAPPPPVAPGSPANGAESNQQGAASPLTFYETLPKGSRAVMGSGLNLAPAKPLDSSAQQAAVPQPATATPTPGAKTSDLAQKPATAPGEQAAKTAPATTTKPAPAATPSAAVKTPAAQTTKPPAEKSAGYTVQAASCQTRSEAEQIKNRLLKSGNNAYIVEASVPGKGTWYRVRIGKGLNQAQAMDIAAKAGAGAEAIPER